MLRLSGSVTAARSGFARSVTPPDYFLFLSFQHFNPANPHFFKIFQPPATARRLCLPANVMFPRRRVEPPLGLPHPDLGPPRLQKHCFIRSQLFRMRISVFDERVAKLSSRWIAVIEYGR